MKGKTKTKPPPPEARSSLPLVGPAVGRHSQLDHPVGRLEILGMDTGAAKPKLGQCREHAMGVRFVRANQEIDIWRSQRRSQSSSQVIDEAASARSRNCSIYSLLFWVRSCFNEAASARSRT